MLVVDSSSSVRTSVWMILKDEYVVLTVSGLEEALEVVGREGVEVVVMGLERPLVYYMQFFRALRGVQPGLGVLLLFGEGLGGEERVDLPGSDWLRKPFGVESLREKVRGLLLQRDWEGGGRGLRVLRSVEERVRAWIGSSRVSGEVRERVVRVSGMSLPVLIQGEEGTGRGGVARAVHYLGLWKERPFLRVFCRGLTPEVFVRRLSMWLGGMGGVPVTLYFEGVDRLGWEMQGVLLDLLSDQRVGWPGVGEVGVEARVVSSSEGSLGRAVSEGRFRGDLSEVLGVLRVGLRPLRERREEIPRLVGEVLEEQGWGGEVGKRFSWEAMELLQEYYWPGNVRELEGVVLRSVALKGEGLLGPGDLDFGFTVGEGLPSLGVGVGKGLEGEVSSGSEVLGEEENFFDVVVSALAHEIKNPLVAINTFAYLLPEKYEDEEFRGQFSRLVSMDVRRVNEVLESLLEYAQFSGPRLRGQDLNLVLEGVLGEREEDLGRKGLRVERDFGEGLPLVLFDGMQLGFVLRSLIGGLVSQVRGGKVLRVSTGKGEGYVEMRVRYEDGEGVYGGELKGEGMGMERWSLALALARRVMVRNGGEMGVSSEEGAGVVIRLRFRVVGRSEAGDIKGSHA